MQADTLFILFKEQNGYLTPEHPITIENMGLGDMIESFRKNAWWEIRIIDLDILNGKLFADTISYKCSELDFPAKQIQLSAYYKRIQKISFRNIQTEGLLKTAVFKKQSRSSSVPERMPLDESAETLTSQISEEPQSDKLLIEKLQGSFYVPIKALNFRLGGVSCNRRIVGFEEPLEFFIENDYLREEFDAVKNYFTRVLNTQKIQIKYEIRIQGKIIQEMRARSPEISLITRDTIENVRFEFVNGNIRRKIKGIEDKSLFTMEEVFEHASDGQLPPGAFYKDADTFLQDLMKVSQTKHYHHLRYLSSLHAHSIMKLRFVLKPLSFIFLITGERYYYLIWETLDTAEATYIWRSEKSKDALKANFHKVEDILNLIKIQGKIAYINSGDENMKRIYHDYSEVKNGFISWKAELESILR